MTIFFCREIPVFNANSVDPDQTLHSAASDLGLHCLPITLFGVSRRNKMLTLTAQKTKTDPFVNNVDPNKTAHNEPSHQDLHCLAFCLKFSDVLKLELLFHVFPNGIHRVQEKV